MNTIDMHIHTNNSDGSKTVEEVLKEAEELGLKLISITDHESIGAYPEVMRNRQLFTGTIITGVELKTYCKGREIELLGYDFDLEIMKKQLPKLYKSKEEINRSYLNAIIEQLLKCGIIIPKDLATQYTDFTVQPAKFVSKFMMNDKENLDMNMKKLFDDRIEHGQNESLYRGWLSNPKSNFYVQYQAYPDYPETIQLIHDSNGYVSIPHIYQYGDMSEEILEELLSAAGQIDGIECYYTTFTAEQTSYLLKKCKESNLIISGGSDYHGVNKPNMLGKGFGDLYIPEEHAKFWLQNTKNRL